MGIRWSEANCGFNTTPVDQLSEGASGYAQHGEVFQFFGTDFVMGARAGFCIDLPDTFTGSQGVTATCNCGRECYARPVVPFDSDLAQKSNLANMELTMTRRQIFPNRVTGGFLLSVLALVTAVQKIHGAPTFQVWDTSQPLRETFDLSERTSWKRVPPEITTLEADPSKASSDPGYYGREYAFGGDAVVENEKITAVFSSSNGQAIIYARPALDTTGHPSAESKKGSAIVRLAPLQSGTNSTAIKRFEILRYAGDEFTIATFYAGTGSVEPSAIFSFGKGAIVEVKSAAGLTGFRLSAPLEYGVVPSFIGDDLLLAPSEYASSDELFAPSENMFVGLAEGEQSMLVMTWPKGSQQLKLNLGNDSDGKRLIQSIDFQNAGHSFYLAPLTAPGIWHRESLTAGFLEKDNPIQWKPPFSATWKTELDEAGARTTFAFRSNKGQVWRGVPGSYIYPVWLEQGQAFYHLSKKIPPKGDSVIYFLEGNETPVSVLTPADMLQSTLGREMSETILDPTGRKLRTHHRRAGAGVHRACTCGCTEAIQAVFEARQESERKDYIDGAIEDMLFFVRAHVARIEEYRRFANDMAQYLRDKTSQSPTLKEYLDTLDQIVQQIPQEYSVQAENMKSLTFADELRQKTLALADKKDAHNLETYMELLKEWRGMGGAQDYVVARCHMITRQLLQEAGAGCAQRPQAVPVAEEVRARCRQVLRNPDGYEIWANY